MRPKEKQDSLEEVLSSHAQRFFRILAQDVRHPAQPEVTTARRPGEIHVIGWVVRNSAAVSLARTQVLMI